MRCCVGRCFGFWVVLGISVCDLGGVLDCIWDFGVGFGGCFVSCRVSLVD